MSKIPVNKFLFKLYRDNFEDYMSLREDYPVGVEIADFTKADVWANGDVFQTRIDFYREHLSGLDIFKTFHGPFWGMDPQSGDPDIQQLSRDKILRSIDTAQSLGCKRIVFHSGYIPMINIPYQIEQLLKVSVEFWDETVQSCNIEICLENAWEWDTYFHETIINHADNPRLNLCLDAGHIHAFSRISAREWFSTFGKNITHLHWHDNHLAQDEHLPPGQGKIDWKEMLALRQEFCPDSEIVLELKKVQDFRDSIEYLSNLTKSSD